MTDRVLITGVSGFIASHTAAKLLEKGYRVRGTVRNLKKGQRVREAIANTGVNVEALELVEANLAADAGWKTIVKECRYILHMASPMPFDPPKHREALVPEARAGAMRVIAQGYGSGAERIVMTASSLTMTGQPDRGRTLHYTESDWTDPEWKKLSAYPVSKTRAERSAWSWVETHGFKDQFVTICPGLVLGPDPYKNGGASIALIQAMFDGDFPRVPKLAYPIIDVRDCASLHCAALTAPKVGGRRLIAAGNTLWFKEIAALLRSEYPKARDLPKGELPNFITKLAAHVDDRIHAITADLGVYMTADVGYVTNLTGVIPRPAKEAVKATAQSLQGE